VAKKHTVIHATAFTDHFATILHIEGPPSITNHGRGYWKLNASLLTDPHVGDSFQCEWEVCNKVMKRYQSPVHWWVIHVKPRMGKLFQRLGSERKTDHKKLEHFYYSVIYDLLCDNRDNREKMSALQHLKAKIIRLNDNYYKAMMLDNRDKDGYGNEQPTLFHLLQTQK
jgi:hypothetical protein